MSAETDAPANGLPQVLTFTGEFGTELNSFLPVIYFLHLNGVMRGRVVETYTGMAPFYCFLDPGQIIERALPRAYVPPPQRPEYLPNRNDHAAGKTRFEVFPNYRALLPKLPLSGAKPVLVMHNKYCEEWGGPPVNFLAVKVLGDLLEALVPHFTVVYLRPGIGTLAPTYSRDHQPDFDLGEGELIRSYPDVLLFEDLMAALGSKNYNLIKLRLFAGSYFHLTVQGGNAHMTALFSGSLVAIFHRLGAEIGRSYLNGHFSYASSPPPRYLIARNVSQLHSAVAVLCGSTLGETAVTVPASLEPAAEALSPARQCGLDTYPLQDDESVAHEPA